jgi:hypothetical protein
MGLPIKIRGLKKVDTPFIMDSWMRTNRKKPEFKWCSDATYWVEYGNYIYGLLASNEFEIRVACNPDSEDFIYGFSLAKDGEHIFSYIKKTFRVNSVKEALYEGIKNSPETTD